MVLGNTDAQQGDYCDGVPHPQWILDVHDDFPSAEQVAQRIPDAIVMSEHDVRMGNWPTVKGPVVGYGTMRAMRNMQRMPILGAGVFDDYPMLRCSSYYRIIYDLLDRMCLFVPFSALRSLPLQQMFGSRLFVRSDTNYKLFPAAVLNTDDVGQWLDLYREHSTEFVVLSEVVQFDREYRCFCRGGTMFCGSSYPQKPYEGVPDDVRDFAETTARRLLSLGLAMVTVDVGVSNENGVQRLRVVEIGGVNSWGLYGSDIDEFIHTMEAEAVARLETMQFP